MKKIKVNFVCMGNICRSPTSEGVFSHFVEKAGLSDVITTDSSGTHSYHIGSEPDGRAQAACNSRGYDLSQLKARKFIAEDFHEFDYLIAMDADNYANMDSLRPEGEVGSLHLFLEFAKNHTEKEVPDPYYGGNSGFERVLDMVEDASQGLLEVIQKKYNL